MNISTEKESDFKELPHKNISAIELVEIISDIGANITQKEIQEFRNSLDENMKIIFDDQAEEMKLGIMVAGKLNENEQRAIENIQINQILGVHQIKTCISMRMMLISGMQKHQKMPI